MSIFNSPFVVGFDYVERILDHIAKSANESYPPYNIEHLTPRTLRITVAVAGFSKEELSVTIEDNQLIIHGKQVEDANKAYLHRGIAARQFQRRFILADGIDVIAACLENGLLNVDLRQPEPSSEVRQIAISTGPATNPEQVENIRKIPQRRQS